MGVVPRPLLPRLRTSDLAGTGESSFAGNSQRAALPLVEGVSAPRNEGTTTSLESLLRRFAEGGMAEETLKLLVQSKITEDEVSCLVQRRNNVERVADLRNAAKCSL